MPSKQIVVGLAGASLIFVAGCGAGSTSTAIATVATTVPVSTHSPVATGPVPARLVQRYMHWYARSQANRRMHWHVHIHRHVDIGVPHTDAANAPHFDPPQAAMRYVAAAWNAHDLADLKHVTDPSARAGLHTMRSEAVRLALGHCDKQPAGDYYCTFTHEYPNANVQRLEETDGNGIGHAYFLAAPADGPGWYMTGFQGCGG